VLSNTFTASTVLIRPNGWRGAKPSLRNSFSIVAGDHPHRILIHDRDIIYSDHVDRMIAAMGLVVLKTGVRSPQANPVPRTIDRDDPGANVRPG
jgi:hypothetical protein